MGHIKRFISSISEDTPISIGVVVILIGFSIWLTELKLDTRANAETLSYLQSKADQNEVKFQEIKERLIRIEDALKKDLGSDYDK